MSSFKKQISKKNKARWNILPTWIKFFTWYFLFISPFVILSSLIDFWVYGNLEGDLYGLKNIPIKNIGELILILCGVKFLVAYGYFFQKDWAIKVGITDAIISILICIFVIVITGLYGHLNFRFEIIILLFYYNKLQTVKEQWSNIKM